MRRLPQTILSCRAEARFPVLYLLLRKAKEGQRASYATKCAMATFNVPVFRQCSMEEKYYKLTFNKLEPDFAEILWGPRYAPQHVAY